MSTEYPFVMSPLYGDCFRWTTFDLPMNGEQTCHIWHKYGLPEGIEHIRLLDHRDGRAWIVPDGGWNCDPLPVSPDMTYDEAFRRLTRSALGPRLEFVRPNPGDPGAYSFTWSIVPPENPYTTWMEGEHADHDHPPPEA